MRFPYLLYQLPAKKGLSRVQPLFLPAIHLYSLPHLWHFKSSGNNQHIRQQADSKRNARKGNREFVALLPHIPQPPGHENREHEHKYIHQHILDRSSLHQATKALFSPFFLL